MVMKIQTKSVTTLDTFVTPKKFYEDEYASISFVESVPCVKLTLSGVPHSSDHFQLVYNKMVEFVNLEVDNYCKLHLLTDSTHSGLVLQDDISFYQANIIPALEKAGIRYHALVLPQSILGKLVLRETSLSTRKLKVEFFNNVSGACKWLKNR
jgi:hypothetical protein